jgi:ABC-type transport system involved in multi-copper enzyme maturation permease subunit
MGNIIHTEWLKLKKYWAFWLIFIVTTLSYPGINYMFYYEYQQMLGKESKAGAMVKLLIGNPFELPEAWHTVGFFSSIFVFIPAILVIMLITNEYSFKTQRQNIIDGWSRAQFIIGKLFSVLLISLLITLLYIIITLVIGFSNGASLATLTGAQTEYIGYFALQTFSQLSLAFLIGFLVRRAFLALGLFIFYFLILENYLVAIFKKYGTDQGRFLPIEMSDRMIPVPAFLGKLSNPERYQHLVDSIPTHLGLTVLLTIIIWSLCFLINQKRDI